MEKQNDVEDPEREAGAAEAIAESLSFPEVYRMIQAGEEVPGLQKLEIKPCHDQPTVSQMPRKSKPWEKWLFPNNKIWTGLQYCLYANVIKFFLALQFMTLIHGTCTAHMNVK